MASESKPVSQPAGALAGVSRREAGVRIFSYPKVIFLFPTLIVTLICWIGMLMAGNPTPTRHEASAQTRASGEAHAAGETTTNASAPVGSSAFETPQNLFAVLFLGVFAFNLLIMALDFPRFTIVGILLLVLFGVFFVLWVGAYFNVDLMHWFRALVANLYVIANAQFYFLLSMIFLAVFGLTYITRYLDYWEIHPNEILHHHGPLSDLERYPTTNLKFDKEIPDVLEHLFLGAGRLVLHFSQEHRSVVLENVLFINGIEERLKSLMSRMEVRLTTDREIAEL